MSNRRVSGRPVPLLADLTLDQAVESVTRRVAAYHRNRCDVLVDTDGYLRVMNAYRRRYKVIQPKIRIGSFTRSTPADAVRRAISEVMK